MNWIAGLLLATVLVATAPGGPRITIKKAPSGSVTATLNWVDNSTNETGFRIYRKTGKGAFAVVGTVGANVTQFTESGLKPNTSYTYRIGAYNTINEVFGPTTTARTPRN